MDPHFAHLAEGNARQARKRVAAEVLVRDEEEITRWRFADVDGLHSEMRAHIWRRLHAAADSVRTGSTVYRQHQP